MAAPAARPAVPPAWARWRDALGGLRPELYRFVVLWDEVQPDPAVPANLDLPVAGCLRDEPPCLGWAGVRDQLRAIASRQAADPGWQALVVFSDAPDWAGVTPRGCRDRAGDRAPRGSAIPAYRALVRAVLAAAAREGAELRFASPWNEPNLPFFLAPQRAACEAGARSLAALPYGRLARAMRAELGPEHTLVLGETAGVVPRTPRSTAVGELIRALPRELVCAAPVWSQHAYVGGTDPVDAVAAALGAHDCPRAHAVWITETGVGPAPAALSAAERRGQDAAACRALHRRLVRWHADPRVAVALQYTFREDDRFPVGLATTDLARPRPALRAWRAWGRRPAPDAPPPPAPCRS